MLSRLETAIPKREIHVPALLHRMTSRGRENSPAQKIAVNTVE
ncbi:hypothetical protein Agau_C200896 [Agrobacterium tumefaciens F2]|nr:hypothetical protein Agau_C200896 [Agrobacterium tumefaciens F2]